MSANTVPTFPLAFRVAVVKVDTAEASLTAPTNVGTVFTAGANGSVVERVRVKARGTNTAGIVRLFLYDGTTYYLLDEILTVATVPSVTVPSYVYDWVPPGIALYLATGWSLRATTDNGEDYNVIAFGGDF